MKKIFLITTGILLIAFTFYSCKKNITDPITEEQAVQQLLRSESFVDFTKDFIPDLSSLLIYHRTIHTHNRSNDFSRAVNIAGNDEAKLATAYRSSSLNFEKAVLLKNKTDNDLLRLLNKNSYLLRFNEVQIQNIVIKALDEARTSTDTKWQQVKEGINNRMRRTSPTLFEATGFDPTDTPLIDTNPDDMALVDLGITWDEVWGCLKEAVGFGTAGILGVAGLKKLAEEGFQEIIITTTKFLAKHAGWFGLAIAVIDFSSCMYKENKD